MIDEEFKKIFEQYPNPNIELLEDDLLKNGCRDAIVLWNGVIIDGYNRYNICQKHNIPFKTISYEFANRQEAHAWILDNQFQRRNLPDFAYIELKQAYKEKLLEIGKEKQKETIGGYKWQDKSVLSTMDKTDKSHNTREQLATELNIGTGTLARGEIVAKKAPEEVKQKVRTGKISINQAYKEVKKEQQKQEQQIERAKLAEAGKTKNIDIDFRLGDFEEVFANLPNNSVDCIITDPPYAYEFIECWTKLSRFAKRVLKPNSFCITYSGQANLPHVIHKMSEFLDYYWTFAVYHKGGTQIVNGYNLMCRWKPVLIYQNGKKKIQNVVEDFFNSDRREKDAHDWQQSESGVTYLIEKFTKPNDLIIDPFAGSGTTLIAALKKGRQVKGAEINEETYNIARQRL